MTADLQRELMDAGYQEIRGPAGRRLLEESQGGERLRAIVADRDAEPAARFLAACVLDDHGAADGLGDDQLAAAYVEGLRAGVTADAANHWGIPGVMTGSLAERVAALGDAARGPLVAALDDDTPMEFIGSREATIGNSYGWRVKDQAAVLLARLTGSTFDVERDPAARDANIDALRRTI